jgi:ornithine carbamoyltransferase
MSVDLRHGSLLPVRDYTAEELRYLIALAAELKAAAKAGTEQQRLTGKKIALIFEKTSTRTRCAFKVAAYDQGAHVTYLGPEGSQIGHKESITGAKLGMDVRICAPRALWPDQGMMDTARVLATESGARLTVTEDVAEGVRQAGYICTDVWVSMGEDKSVCAARIALLKPYQVNSRMIELTGNPQVKFMHCLSAFHDRHTKVGEQIYEESGLDALEVTDDVFESERSIAFDEAENRMHTIKAALVATLGS